MFPKEKSELIILDKESLAILKIIPSLLSKKFGL